MKANKKQKPKQSRKQKAQAEMERYQKLLLAEITRHVGAGRKIGMGELYYRITGKTYRHRINDTRLLRKVITACRREGIPIVSDVSHSGGGYYLASAGSELEAYCKRIRSRALRILAQESRLRNLNMPELLGQIQLELGQSGPGAP